MMDSCTLSSYPVDWTGQQKKEASERKELGNQVYSLNSQLQQIASEIVDMKKELAALEAEEVTKDEAKERRSAVVRETRKIVDLIADRKTTIRRLQYQIDNNGMHASIMHVVEDSDQVYMLGESLAHIEQMIAEFQATVNEKKLELAELDNQVAMKEKELADMQANQVTNLDSLCGDLKRVQAEFHSDGESEDEDEYVLMSEPDDYCCRMLGVCNGRTDFDTSNSLSWAADGSLCSKTTSN